MSELRFRRSGAKTTQSDANLPRPPSSQAYSYCSSLKQVLPYLAGHQRLVFSLPAVRFPGLAWLGSILFSRQYFGTGSHMNNTLGILLFLILIVWSQKYSVRCLVALWLTATAGDGVVSRTRHDEGHLY